MNYRTKRRFRTLLVNGLRLMLLTGIYLFIGGACRAAYSQIPTSEVTVKVLPPSPIDPVVITDIRDGAQNITPGTPFHPEGNWLSALHLAVINQSTKTIVALTISIDFPETGNGSRFSPIVGDTMFIGIRPPSHRTTINGEVLPPMQNKAIAIPPGASLKNIDLGSQFPRYESLLQNSSLKGSLPHLCRISISTVSFADGTLWGNGIYQIPDTEHPGHFKLADPNDFIANPSH